VTAPGAPDVTQAIDIDGFVVALSDLVAARGFSHRDLARTAGPLLRPPQTLSKSTISELLSPGRKRLNLDLVVAVVRALGADEGEVDVWRQACLRVHATAKTGGPAGVFRQLPADLSTFTGREAAVSELLAAAASPEGTSRTATVVISAIEGMGGVGKTQLAVHVAHALVRTGRYADAQLFANLRGFDPESPPVDPSAALEAFLRALGVPALHIPEDRDGRAAMYRDRLHGMKALVVLDNAADEEQVRDLIPAGPHCLVLVTSRRSLAGLDGAVQHVLDVFSDYEAVELLARIAGRERVAAEPESATELVRLCGALPLAVALAAARLRSRPAWRLADLLDRLRAHGPGVVSQGGRSLRPVFDLSYRVLEPRTRRLFCVLSLHPGTTVDAYAAASLADVSDAEAETALAELLDQHLLEQHSAEYATFHDLLRTLASEKLAETTTPEERHAARLRVFDYYRYMASAAVDLVDPATRHRRPRIDRPATPTHTFADEADARSWLERELPNLLAIAAEAPAPHRRDLSKTLWRHLYDQGCFREGLTLHGLAIEACQEAGDAAGLADSLRFAATTCIRIGRYEPADAMLQTAIEITTDANDLAAALAARGNLFQQIGRFQDAFDHHEKALALHRRAGERLGEAIDLNNLGVMQWELGHYTRALDYLTQALEAFGEIRSHSRTEVLLSMAAVHERIGQYSQAVDILREALELGSAQGAGAVQARALRQLGIALTGLGDHTEALESLRQALALYVDSGERTGEGECRYGIGLCLLTSERPAEALTWFHEAVVIADELGEPSHRARALNALGSALLASDRAREALDLQRDALGIATLLSDPYLVARIHEGIGRTQVSLGDHDAARAHLVSALAGYTALDVPDRKMIASDPLLSAIVSSQ
jgi:tetratricopeptide (TPR) repeat protein